MAKRRKILNDQNAGGVVDELRRQHNHLLLVLQNISEQVDAATITATEGFVALGLTISTGLDSSVATINGGANTYTGTGLEVLGIKVEPRQPRFPTRGNTTMVKTDDDL